MGDATAFLRSYAVGIRGGRVDVRVIPPPDAAMITLLDATDRGARDPADMIQRVRKVADASGYVLSLTGEPNFYAVGAHHEPYNVRTITLTKV